MEIDQLVRDMNERAQRIRDLRPVGDEVHAELLAWQRTFDAGPEKNRLDPSLQNPAHPEHVWRVGNRRFKFGTRVPYSKFYQEHLLETGQQSHLAVPNYVIERIAKKVVHYVWEGRTL